MPARSPRINVCVTQEQHAILLELGGYMGRSAASFLREMLDSATPLLRASLPLHREAARDIESQPDALQGVIDDALGQLRDAGVDTNQLDFLDGLKTETNSQDGERGAPQSEVSKRRAHLPPSSNTGVRSEGPEGELVRSQSLSRKSSNG